MIFVESFGRAQSCGRAAAKAVSLLAGALAASMLGACTTETSCEALCSELVYSCDYAAYPSVDSCLQGCEYDASKGADVEAELECIQDAKCDPIETVSCARTFNPEAGAR